MVNVQAVFCTLIGLHPHAAAPVMDSRSDNVPVIECAGFFFFCLQCGNSLNLREQGLHATLGYWTN